MPRETAHKIRAQPVCVNGRTYRRYIVDCRDEQGRRLRKSFGSLAEAEAFSRKYAKGEARRAEEQAILRNRIGEDASRLPHAALKDAVEALALLAGRASLASAARWYAAELDRRARTVPTVRELTDQYLQASLAADLRKATIIDIRHRLGRFCQRFGRRRIDEVTRAEVTDWVDDLRGVDGSRLAPMTRKHFRIQVGALFNFAIERDLLSANPALNATRSRRSGSKARVESPIEIFTPAEARALLEAARQHVPSMLAPLALGLFAGIRTAELRRLTWERHIDLAKGIVAISADVAKKRSTRNVTIQPNLACWLTCVTDRTGAVAPQSGFAWRKALMKVREEARLARWPGNAMRHSFGSYHLEHFGDPGKTSLEMGHRGGDLLFEHYRQLVTREDASAYWQIVPKGT